MSEVEGKTLSIYFRIDEGVIEHNNRIFIAKNVDGERVYQRHIRCLFLSDFGEQAEIHLSDHDK